MNSSKRLNFCGSPNQKATKRWGTLGKYSFLCVLFDPASDRNSNVHTARMSPACQPQRGTQHSPGDTRASRHQHQPASLDIKQVSTRGATTRIHTVSRSRAQPHSLALNVPSQIQASLNRLLGAALTLPPAIVTSRTPPTAAHHRAIHAEAHHT